MLGEAGRYFRTAADVRTRIEDSESDVALTVELGTLARIQAKRYDWDEVTDRYEELCLRLAGRDRALSGAGHRAGPADDTVIEMAQRQPSPIDFPAAEQLVPVDVSVRPDRRTGPPVGLTRSGRPPRRPPDTHSMRDRPTRTSTAMPGTDQVTRPVARRITPERPADAEPVTMSYREALHTLKSRQKSGKGAPAYSRFVNRRLGRYLAAAAYQAGLTPNAVTALSRAVLVRRHRACSPCCRRRSRWPSR